MSAFRCRHFAGEVIRWTVRWYCRYGINYCELEEMLSARGSNLRSSVAKPFQKRGDELVPLRIELLDRASESDGLLS